MDDRQTVAMIGLGAMGSRMAARLLDAGYDVVAYNRSDGPASALAARGATKAPTAREAVQGCSVAISCVRDDDAARAIWLDEKAGALAAMTAGQVVIESSTLTPACVREIAAAAAARGVSYLDAPVVGSRPQAEAGQLAYLVGGDQAVVERVRPLLDVLGGAIFHVGGTGTGAVLKLAVNALLGIQVTALAEALAWVAKAGVPAQAAFDILSALPVTSPVAKGAGALMIAKNHAPLFPIDLIAKDLGYAQATASSAGAELPMASAAARTMTQARDAGYGALNMTAVAKLFE